MKIKSQRLIYSIDDRKNLQKAIALQNVLISHESLVDWNPRNCEKTDRVVDLFGDHAKVKCGIKHCESLLVSTG